MTAKIPISAAIAACLVVTPLFSAPHHDLSLSTRRSELALSSCRKLLARMRQDPATDTWHNRMTVWPCYRNSQYQRQDLASAGSRTLQ